MAIKAGTIVFATDDSPKGVADARAWLKEKNLTPDDVHFYQAEGMTLIAAKHPLKL
jgi:hypothetical protein